MTQLVQLEDSIVKIGELEVGGDNTGIGVVSRVLDGGKVIDRALLGHNDDAAGMLACGTFDTDQTFYQIVDLCTGERHTLVFQIFHNKAEGGFGGKSTDGACTEYVAFTEELFGVFMYSALHIP